MPSFIHSYCTVLYCTAIYCIALCNEWPVLYCTALYCTSRCCTVLYLTVTTRQHTRPVTVLYLVPLDLDQDLDQDMDMDQDLGPK